LAARMADYRQALRTLYTRPLASFVAERKRLAAGLRAGRDPDAAKRLERLRRPTVSAWTVNQLYWHARDAFDALLAAAAPIRKGDLGGTAAYREALKELRTRAAVVLREASHAATEATLRRVMGTLAAVAAAGGFDPDPPGALATDREPPGFEAVGERDPAAAHARHSDSGGRSAVSRPAASERKHLAAEQAKRRAETKAREAERQRLKTAVRHASATVQARERALGVVQKRLQAAGEAVEDARQVLRELERKLTRLDQAE
jgi:hypothetical protein